MDKFISEFMRAYAPFCCFIFLVVLAAVAIYYVIASRDRFKHPEEYKTKGMAGERSAFLELTRKYHVPENQILRNVYIPTKNGTTEIDLLVISKKGLLVFECKNYSGNVYGDGNHDKWVQYLGKTRNYFLSPVVQNRYHAKCLKEYFHGIEDLPVISFVVTTGNANWKLKNIKPEDHVLFWTGVRFGDVYSKLENSEVMAKNFRKIYASLKKLERPDETVRQAHIESLKQKRK